MFYLNIVAVFLHSNVCTDDKQVYPLRYEIYNNDIKNFQVLPHTQDTRIIHYDGQFASNSHLFW